MALVDVVKCDVNDKELVYKFPSEDLKIGTQLVVYSGQTAFFVKGGRIFDQFESGTYTIKTENIPLLNKIINLPFGGATPFKAEIWFINQLAILDSKWGTATPIQLEDPKYEIIVPVRAYGQYGLKVGNPKLFLESLVGNQTSFTTRKIGEYFKGEIMSQLSNLISTKVTEEKISILTINSHLNILSRYINNELNVQFEKYGLTLENFKIISISIPEDDPSFLKLKEAKDLAARLKIAGKDVYQMERSFNVLDAAASNENGGNNLLNTGLGLGVGMSVGRQAGTIAAQNMQTNIVPPPLPPTPQYYIIINGQQNGPFDYNTIASYVASQQVSAEMLAWKPGINGWTKIGQFPEFISLFNNCPPPLPPTL